MFKFESRTISPHLAMALKTVIRLVTVSVNHLILHQDFYLIKIYHLKETIF